MEMARLTDRSHIYTYDHLLSRARGSTVRSHDDNWTLFFSDEDREMQLKAQEKANKSTLS